jgi:hypothetical protein
LLSGASTITMAHSAFKHNCGEVELKSMFCIEALRCPYAKPTRSIIKYATALPLRPGFGYTAAIYSAGVRHITSAGKLFQLP